MKLMTQLLVLVAILSPKTSFAGKQKYWNADSAKLYITTMKYFDSYERGYFGAPKSGEQHAQLNFLYPESFADDGVHCLLAGYTGVINTKTAHCETDSTVYATDLAMCKSQGFDFPCSRDIFSTTANPLICGNITSGNRWTASCSANFFDKIGLSGKMLDSQFSDADYAKLAVQLNASGVNIDTVLGKVKSLCSAVAESKRSMDIRDCKKLEANFDSTSKNAPTTPPVVAKTETTTTTTQTAMNANAQTTTVTNNAAANTAGSDSLKKIIDSGALTKVGTGATCDTDKPDSCNAAALTQNCSIFNQAKDHYFPDGTMIPSLKKQWDADNARRNDKVNSLRIANDQVRINKDYADAQKILGKSLDRMPTLTASIDPTGTSSTQLLWDLLRDSPTTKAPIAPMVWNEGGKTTYDPNPKYDDIRNYFDEYVSKRKKEKIRAELTDAYNMSKLDHVLATGYSPALDAKSVTEEQNARVQKLINTTKEGLIKVIMNGKTEKDLSVAEKDSIERIRTIQVNLPNNPKVSENKLCDNVNGNAFYMPSEHSINICASDLKYPDESLIRTLAHEMGHSIDPCNFQNDTPIFKIDLSKADSFANAQSPIKGQVASAIARCKATGSTTCSVLLTDRVEAAKLVSVGILSRDAPGEKLSDYPFEGVKSCLQSPEGGNFHSNQVPIENLQLEAENAVDELDQGANLNDKDKLAQQQRMKSLLSTKPECGSNYMKTPSKMQEVMADWFGNEVLNDYLITHPRVGDSPEDKLRPIAFLARGYCQEVGAVKSQNGLNGVINIMENDTHPLSVDRIDEIALREPKIREYLGCTPLPLSNKKKCSR